MQWNTIIRLICIGGYTWFEYKGFGEQGGSGQNRFGDQGGAQIWRRRGECRFKRRRWIIREE